MKRTEPTTNLILKLNPTTGNLTLHTAGISKAEVEQMEKDLQELFSQQGIKATVTLKEGGEV